jgi:hypothetical protein
MVAILREADRGTVTEVARKHKVSAAYEAMINTKRVTPELIRRMCLANVSVHIGYT